MHDWEKTRHGTYEQQPDCCNEREFYRESITIPIHVKFDNYEETVTKLHVCIELAEHLQRTIDGILKKTDVSARNGNSDSEL